MLVEFYMVESLTLRSLGWSRKQCLLDCIQGVNYITHVLILGTLVVMGYHSLGLVYLWLQNAQVIQS